MSKALEGARRKGREAGEAGLPRSANPYPDKRSNYQNGVTFSTAFIRAWDDGWREGYKIEQPFMLIRE